MEIISRCYFCDTPYEVFTCIHIELHEKTNSDIYILDRFESASNLSKSLVKTKLFRRVKLIKEGDLYKRGSYINSFKTYFNVNKLAEKFIEKNTVYKYMYFSCRVLCFRIARFYFIKNNFPTKFIMFDEGIGSYYGQFEHTLLINTIIKRIMFGKDGASMRFETYLYSPELHYDYHNRKHELYKLPSFDEVDNNYINNYLNIFDIKHGYIEKKCIFFDGVRHELFKSEYALQQMQDWYQMIEDILGADNILIKSHPRENKNYPHKCADYPVSNAPIEIDYLQMNIDQVILISVASTAVISPKMIFDKEPIVLLMCNMNSNIFVPDSRQLNLYKKIQSLYKNKQNFMMPTGIDELRECVYYIKQFINKEWN